MAPKGQKDDRAESGAVTQLCHVIRLECSSHHVDMIMLCSQQLTAIHRLIQEARVGSEAEHFSCWIY